MNRINTFSQPIVLLSLALITFTLFTYEILVTRLFSAIMWYHFVFIAISLVILCIGLGGIYVYNQNKKFKGKDKNSLYLLLMQRSSLLMAISIPLNTVLIYKIPFSQILFIPYLLLAAIPFVAAGVFISASFKMFSGWSHLLYFSDLLGSALGGILIVQLLNYFSILRVSFMLALLPLIVYIMLSISALNWQTRKSLIATGCWVLLTGTILFGGTNIDTWSGSFKAYEGNAKVLGMFDKSRILYTTWNSFTRTDVVDTGDPQEMYLMLDGSATSPMIRYGGDLKKIEYLKEEPGYLAFSNNQNDNALLVGPGGGLDILLAKLAGIKQIDAVEINTGSVLATEYFSEYSGNPYHLPGVKSYIKDGRTFAELTDKQYDVIYISKVMTQASESLGYALSENYVYTLEAFETYLNKLTPGGNLAMVLHGDSDLKKAMVTALKVLESKGFSSDEAINSMAVISEKSSHSDSIMYPLLLIKNKPFTAAESKMLLNSITSEQKAVYVPHIIKNNNLVGAIQEPSKIRPATDDSPFFYNQGGSMVTLLLITLILVLYIGFKYFGIIINKQSEVLNYTSYFMLLGAGFMLIEVPLVQKFILFFGHPTTAFTTVMATLLLFGGIGSLIGKYLSTEQSIRYSAFIVAVLSTILAVILPWVFLEWQHSSSFNKIIVTIALLGPLGLVLGIPFPSGIRLLTEKLKKGSEYVPLMWGVNGWMSVVGSILAMIVAMILGFNWSLFLGALAYVIVFSRIKTMAK